MDENDELQLQSLLVSFGLPEVFEELNRKGVTFKSLKFLTADDIRDAIGNIGIRAEFRYKLLGWQKSQNFGEDSGEEQDQEIPIAGAAKPKLVADILKGYPRGRFLLEQYNLKNTLTTDQRDQIISIIIEDISARKQTLKTTDFADIVNQIVEVFPSEKNWRDVYYRPRNLIQKHPAGKLYWKYANLRSKLLKRGRSGPLQESDPVSQTSGFADITSFALKAELKREISDWLSVCQKWRESHAQRKKDIELLDGPQFLKEWPKYGDCRAPDLIKIDFNLLYPEKGDILFRKWDPFKEKVFCFYGDHIQNKECLRILKTAQKTVSIDSKDYIYTILLTSVVSNNSWAVIKGTNKRKKFSLLDSQESLVLRINSIADYEEKLQQLIIKYYISSETVQPFLIVEGECIENLTGFFVYFDKSLYKFDSFIESLDVCFKIFNTLNLKYPVPSEFAWLFIQQYIYDIHTPYDKKSSNLTSLLNFMRK
ncbi:uncharacterized protein [Drosophila suzukii]|uniref:SAM domain-containing protein n=1 Tax=Drosophila suzukii TaxID=28584 RepID=A0ABM4TVV9_DROSZ